jgi:hypothetical protein
MKMLLKMLLVTIVFSCGSARAMKSKPTASWLAEKAEYARLEQESLECCRAQYAQRLANSEQLMMNAKEGAWRTVEALLKKPDFRLAKDVVDIDNNTLMHLAVQDRQTPVITLLLAKHGPIEKKNFFNNTPLDIAVNIGYKEGIQLLSKGGQ